MSFNDELRQRQANFQTNGGYNQDAMPQVYQHYKDYVATGQYPYLDPIAKLIASKESVDADLLKYLNTEVYLASKQHQSEKDAERAQTLQADGYAPLTSDAVKLAYTNHQRLQIVAESQGAIFTCQIDSIYKPFVDPTGHCWLLKPKAKTRGYSLFNFQKAFYKVTT